MNNTCAYDCIGILAHLYPQLGFSIDGFRNFVREFLGELADIQLGPDFIEGYINSAGIPVKIALVVLTYDKYDYSKGAPTITPSVTYIGDQQGQILPEYLVLVNSSSANGAGAGHYQICNDNTLRADGCAGLIQELTTHGNLHRISTAIPP